MLDEFNNRLICWFCYLFAFGFITATGWEIVENYFIKKFAHRWGLLFGFLLLETVLIVGTFIGFYQIQELYIG